jgi:hypothetical protein
MFLIWKDSGILRLGSAPKTDGKGQRGLNYNLQSDRGTNLKSLIDIETWEQESKNKLSSFNTLLRKFPQLLKGKDM